MLHHYLDYNSPDSTHWAASTNGNGTVLVQLGDAAGEQVRVSLTPEQARAFAGQVLQKAADAELQLVRQQEDAALQQLRSPDNPARRQSP